MVCGAVRGRRKQALNVGSQMFFFFVQYVFLVCCLRVSVAKICVDIWIHLQSCMFLYFISLFVIYFISSVLWALSSAKTAA